VIGIIFLLQALDEKKPGSSMAAIDFIA
jgi:hypothetical protein